MREILYSPGGVVFYLAETLGYYGATVQQVLAAAAAAGLLDARGRAKQKDFTEDEIRGPILAALRPTLPPSGTTPDSLAAELRDPEPIPELPRRRKR